MLIWSTLLPFGLLLQFLIIYYYYRKAGKIHVMFCNWILIKRGKSSTISLGFSEKLHIFSKRKIHREKYIINNTFHSWHMYNSYWISKNYDSSGQCNGSRLHNGATFLVNSHFIFFLLISRDSFPKMVFRYQNCSSNWEKLLKFEAEGQEFAKFLRSLGQFIQTMKGQNNFW